MTIRLRIPPAFFAIAFLLGLWLEASVERIRLVSGTTSTTPLVVVGCILLGIGLVLGVWAVAEFRRAHTTIFPFRPTTRVVRSGPYRFTRNPMYLGMAVGYTGLALALNVGWPLVLLPVALIGLYFQVIRQEERYLLREFGDEYAEYRRTVRRWISLRGSTKSKSFSTERLDIDA